VIRTRKAENRGEQDVDKAAGRKDGRGGGIGAVASSCCVCALPRSRYLGLHARLVFESRGFAGQSQANCLPGLQSVLVKQLIWRRERNEDPGIDNNFEL
jgi:hypothetical protein